MDFAARGRCGRHVVDGKRQRSIFAAACTEPEGGHGAGAIECGGETRSAKQLRAAKKAERVVIRKKRAQCFDEAKKNKLTGQPQIEFIRTCTAKPN